MRKVKTVKDKVHQVMNKNRKLTHKKKRHKLFVIFPALFVRECIENTDTDEESGMSRNNVNLIIDEDAVVNKLLKLKVDKARGVRNVINVRPGTRINFERVPGYPLKIHNSTITVIESCYSGRHLANN